MLTSKLEGLDQTVANLGDLGQATRRNVLKRVLTKAGEPVANDAAQAAPHRTGRLAFSISVSDKLTRRQRQASPKEYEAEIYIGPAGGNGALNYASFEEFGTIDTPAQPFMRSAWESNRGIVLGLIHSGLSEEVERAAERAARKVARWASVETWMARNG